MSVRELKKEMFIAYAKKFNVFRAYPNLAKLRSVSNDCSILSRILLESSIFWREMKAVRAA